MAERAAKREANKSDAAPQRPRRASR